MRREQKIVAIGAAGGVVGMIVLAKILFILLPSPVGVTSLMDKIGYTLTLNSIALIPFFIMVASVGNARFLSSAINPLAHQESESMEINGRVVDNTLQQNFVFLVGTLALSTFLSPQTMQLIPALVITFIVARMLFWIGYRIDPLYRAPGMAATSYMNLGILLAVLYFFFLH